MTGWVTEWIAPAPASKRRRTPGRQREEPRMPAPGSSYVAIPWSPPPPPHRGNRGGVKDEPATRLGYHASWAAAALDNYPWLGAGGDVFGARRIKDPFQRPTGS